MPAVSSKKILLMRHAKSTQNSGLRDFDRPLNSRGKQDASRMGRYLKELQLIPDQIFSSPAVRTKSTSQIVTVELELKADIIRWEEDFYFADTAAYLTAIQHAGGQAEVVMTVGHNPMTEQAVTTLSHAPFQKHMPTAAVVCLETEVDSWAEVTAGSCKLLWMITPKELNSEF
ncbi:MAG: histidine phosphatase family protein [Balneolaceae bacterium]